MIIIAHLNLKGKDINIITQARPPAVATRAACKQAQAMVSTHVAINVPILINLIQQKKKKFHVAANLMQCLGGGLLRKRKLK